MANIGRKSDIYIDSARSRESLPRRRFICASLRHTTLYIYVSYFVVYFSSSANVVVFVSAPVSFIFAFVCLLLLLFSSLSS